MYWSRFVVNCDSCWDLLFVFIYTCCRFVCLSWFRGFVILAVCLLLLNVVWWWWFPLASVASVVCAGCVVVEFGFTDRNGCLIWLRWLLCIVLFLDRFLLWVCLLFSYLLFTGSCVVYYLIVLFCYDSLCFSFV